MSDKKLAQQKQKLKFLESKITLLKKEKALLVDELNRYYHVKHLIEASQSQITKKLQITHINSEALIRQSVNFLFAFYCDVFKIFARFNDVVDQLKKADPDQANKEALISDLQTNLETFVQQFAFLKKADDYKAAVQKFTQEFSSTHKSEN